MSEFSFLLLLYLPENRLTRLDQILDPVVSGEDHDDLNIQYNLDPPHNKKENVGIADEIYTHVLINSHYSEFDKGTVSMLIDEGVSFKQIGELV